RPLSSRSGTLPAGTPWWNSVAWIRCSHWPRSSTSVLRSRARVRHCWTCAGGIHASGSRPSASSWRRWRASARSVFARRLLPLRAATSAGSARCGTAPASASASHTNSQPVQASTATCTCRPGKRSTHADTASRVESIRPRVTSPLSVSSASKVIWFRCTSYPATIAIRASYRAPAFTNRAKDLALSRGRPCLMPSFGSLAWGKPGFPHVAPFLLSVWGNLPVPPHPLHTLIDHQRMAYEHRRGLPPALPASPAPLGGLASAAGDRRHRAGGDLDRDRGPRTGDRAARPDRPERTPVAAPRARVLVRHRRA